MFTTISSWSRMGQAFALVLCAFALSALSTRAQTSTPAGTTIFNRARILYTEPEGRQAEAMTRTVIVTVTIVNGVVVTPDETTASGSVDRQDTVTARYSICNTGNNPTSFILADASVT